MVLSIVLLLLAVTATSQKGKVEVNRYSLPFNRVGRFRTFCVRLNYANWIRVLTILYWLNLQAKEIKNYALA